MNSKLYARLHAAFTAIGNCRRMGNTEWEIRHTETIARLVADCMPSGAGWDNGTRYDLERWTATKMTFYGSFHHMDEAGGYDGWTDHEITITPSFDGIEIKVGGRNRNDIKDYIHQLFDCALNAEISDDDLLKCA